MDNLFQDPNTMTSTLIIFLVDRYTAEVLDWDLETIALEVQDDFHTEILPSLLDKIAVGQLLLKTDLFHRSLPDFINFCNVMNNEAGIKESWSPADPYEITWAVAEEALLVNEKEEFADDIKAYIATMLRDDGAISTPDSLTFIPNEILAGPRLSKVSEDPLIYQSAYEEGLATSDSLQEYLNKQLLELDKQINSLNLKNGKPVRLT